MWEPGDAEREAEVVAVRLDYTTPPCQHCVERAALHAVRAELCRYCGQRETAPGDPWCRRCIDTFDWMQTCREKALEEKR